MSVDQKIPLYGFNNLTKSLSFSLYKLHYLPSTASEKDYNNYINQTYSSVKLTELLTKVCRAIGGNVLNIASQDYIPQGASVTLMISEEVKPESLVAHLDKSHLCIHTYPEETPKDGIAIFRADIELSTCGIISPLKVLDYVIEEFSADVIDIDYRVRGMTRDLQANKCFNDHKMTRISKYLGKNILEYYSIKDNKLSKVNLFHCKLVRNTIKLNNHLFGATEADLTISAGRDILTQIGLEFDELFSH
ncbi:MAG: adenosylmethionine decarboxylase [Colwellia sp.]|nr:adenosylmethionine decarboxylase [Colwellia sp.]